MNNILTFNIQTCLNDSPYRINRLLHTVKYLNFSVICFQEVSTSDTQNKIKKLFHDYHVFFTDNTELTNIPLESFLPFDIFTFCWLCFEYFFYLLLAIAFWPYAMQKMLIYIFTKVHYWEKIKYLDTQGLCILLSKKHFTSPTLINRKPFEHHGYPLYKWLSITFFRPGYMYVSATSAASSASYIIGNTHLTTGNRHKQIKELLDFVPFLPANIIICGDMNTSSEDELDLFNQLGMTSIGGDLPTYENRKIDYIWTNSSHSSHSSGTIDNLSDHSGLYASESSSSSVSSPSC